MHEPVVVSNLGSENFILSLLCAVVISVASGMVPDDRDFAPRHIFV